MTSHIDPEIDTTPDTEESQSTQSTQTTPLSDPTIIQYLDLITEYQHLRDQLSTHLSAGFFNLTRANYAGAGNMGGLLHKRYGQAGWDQRPCEALVTIDNINERITLKAQDKRESKALRQFGVLTPPALKESQRDFVSGLTAAVELVRVVGQLEEIEKKKKKIEN